MSDKTIETFSESYKFGSEKQAQIRIDSLRNISNLLSARIELREYPEYCQYVVIATYEYKGH